MEYNRPIKPSQRLAAMGKVIRMRTRAAGIATEDADLIAAEAISYFRNGNTAHRALSFADDLIAARVLGVH